MKLRLTGLFILLIALGAAAQITVRVVSIPLNTPNNQDVYIAGSFNGWDPGATLYILHPNADKVREITFTPSVGTHEFKFTRGSWATVEGTSQGSYIPNRKFTYNGTPSTIDLTISGWEGSSNVNSTASDQVSILTDSFYIPQLNRYRRIWLYLPKNYTTSTLSFPVLYMHDGQNLFDKKTSFAGEWQVDEALDSLDKSGYNVAIVVGIDNDGGKRLDEYSPWLNSKYGGGEGDKYIDFIAQTLKPYIDRNYRTIPDADHTGIMGSSMGGLISMYAGIKYPNVFGRIGAFSSSYWFSSQCFEYVNNTGVGTNSYFYMIAGDKEGGSQVKDMNTMYEELKQSGASDAQLFKTSHIDGQHSEWYWRREFPKAFLWLFEKKSTGTIDNISTLSFSMYQSGDFIFFKDIDGSDRQSILFYDISGRLIAENPVSNAVDINRLGLNNGLILIRIGNVTKSIFIRR